MWKALEFMIDACHCHLNESAMLLTWWKSKSCALSVEEGEPVLLSDLDLAINPFLMRAREEGN